MNSARRPALVAALIASASLMQLAYASPVAADDAPQAPAAALLATVEPPHILIVPGTKPNAPTDAVKSLCTPPKAARELMSVPPYPALAKALGQAGSVELSFVVEADGSVAAEGLRVTRSSGFPLLDAAARAHLLAGQRFVPANCSGVALRMPHGFRIVYTLDEAPGRESCQRPTNVAGLPQQPAYPEGARARQEEGTVALAWLYVFCGSDLPSTHRPATSTSRGTCGMPRSLWWMSEMSVCTAARPISFEFWSIPASASPSSTLNAANPT